MNFIRKLQRTLSLIWQLLALWKPVKESNNDPEPHRPHVDTTVPDPADRLP